MSGNHLAGSSLSADEQKQVVAALAAGSLASRDAISSEVRRIGDRQFIGGAFPLFRDRATDTGHLVLLQDWAPTQAFLDELRASLILAGIGGFIIALAGGLVFSHRTSRPLMDIASAARDIAGGDWSRIVPARGSAEATTMATAFNDMTRSLRNQAERLNASYRRFATVTQSARDAIISTDELNNITFWNRSADATDTPETEVLGRPIVNLIVESDRAAYKAALPQPNADDLTFGHIIEVTGMRKDGTRFPVSSRSRLCTDRKGRLHGRRARRHGAEAVAGSAEAARRAIAAGAEDGGDRAPRGRRRPRFQQPADGDSRLRGNDRAEPAGGRRAAHRRGRDSKSVRSRGRPDAAAPGVQPARGDYAAGRRARSPRRNHADHAAAPDRSGDSDRNRDLARSDTSYLPTARSSSRFW